MQFSQVFPLLLMIVSVMAEREVNEEKPAFKDPRSDIDVLHDFFYDDEEIDKTADTSETELSPENDSEEGDSVADSCREPCELGKECQINEEGKAQCICVKSCPEVDKEHSVCSIHNETWNSECALYQMRCMCEENLDGCVSIKYENLEIDYYGPCKDIGECTKEQLADFPHRFRDWLFIIMQELPSRKEQDEAPLLPLKETVDSHSDRKWIDAVLWKFCDLDVNPHDRHLSTDELFPLRGPLLSMEPCMDPFLDECDANDDNLISLQEWGHCLGLENDEIQDECKPPKVKED